MIWFTGLSGSGKSTIAIALERELHKRGLLCRILDGDNIRSGINNNLGFTEADRIENIRRIAEVSKLFVDTGIITIAAFISPSNDIREMAANIIGKDGMQRRVGGRLRTSPVFPLLSRHLLSLRWCWIRLH